jgi:hypothetical protein
MTSGTTTMNEDWRYSDDRMNLREQVYSILLNRFGSQLNENGEPLYSMESITTCCHDWVSQGHSTSSGIVAYYQAYYT